MEKALCYQTDSMWIQIKTLSYTFKKNKNKNNKKKNTGFAMIMCKKIQYSKIKGCKKKKFVWMACQFCKL